MNRAPSVTVFLRITHTYAIVLCSTTQYYYIDDDNIIPIYGGILFRHTMLAEIFGSG